MQAPEAVGIVAAPTSALERCATDLASGALEMVLDAVVVDSVVVAHDG